MRLAVALFAVAILVMASTAAQAAGRRKPPGPSKQLQAAALGRSMHPRYYHGLHARYMQNIGVPTGDIGLRGNSITWTPW